MSTNVVIYTTLLVTNWVAFDMASPGPVLNKEIAVIERRLYGSFECPAGKTNVVFIGCELLDQHPIRDRVATFISYTNWNLIPAPRGIVLPGDVFMKPL